MALIAAFGDYGIGDTLAESQALYDLLLSLCEDRLAWDNILDKPELYTTDEVYNKEEIDEKFDELGDMSLPIDISDVTDLQDELDNRYIKTETDNLLDGKAATIHEHVVADITDFYDAVSSLGIQIVETLPGTVVNGKVYILHPSGDAKFTAYISSGGVYVPLDAVTYSALSIALATKQNLLTGTTGQYVRGDGSYATFNKAAIGLGDVNNTSDLNKPLSTAAITANLLKANDADVLHKDGDETKTSGVLTFAVSPIVPTPIGSGDAVPKGYLSTFLDSILGGDVDILGNLTVGGNVSILGELIVASTSLVTNLNAEFLNGHPDTYFATAVHVHQVLTPGTGLTGSTYDGSTPRTFAVDFGTAAGKAVEGTHVGSGGTAHANATTSVAGFMSAADKTAHDALVIGSVPSTRTITVNGTAGRISSSAGAQSLAADRTWTLDLVSAGTPGTYRSVTTDAYGRVTAGTNPTTVAGYGITDILAQVLTGYTTGSNTAITAASTILGAFQDVQAQISQRVVNTRTLQFTGSAGRITSSNAVASDLSTNRSWNFDLDTVGSAGTYRSVTTDAYGRVTAGTNPTTFAGYGITDLLTQVLTGYSVGSNTAISSSSTFLGAFQNLQGQVNARNSGTGTSGFLTKYTGTNTQGNSLIYESGFQLLIGAADTNQKSLKFNNYNDFWRFEIATQVYSYSEPNAAILITQGGGTAPFDQYGKLLFFGRDSAGYNGGASFYTGSPRALALDLDASGRVGIGGVATSLLHLYYPAAKTSTTQYATIRLDSNDVSNAQYLIISNTGAASLSARTATFQTGEQGINYGGIISLQPDGGTIRLGSGGVDVYGAIRPSGSAGTSGQYLKSAGGYVNTWGAITSGDVTGALGYTPVSSLTDTLQTVMARGATSTIKATFKTGTASGGFEFLRMEPTDYGTGKGALGFVSNGSHNFSISVYDGATYGTVDVIGTLKTNGLTVVDQNRTLTIFGSTQSLAANRTWTMASLDVTTALGFTPATDARTLTIFGSTQSLSSNRTWTMASGDVTTALGYTPVTNARTLTINGVGYDLSANRSWTISGGGSDTWQDVMNRGATSTVRPVIKAGPATGGYDFLRLEPTDYATGKHAFAFTADSPGVWAIYAFDGSTFGTINIIGTGQLNGAPLVTSSSSTLFTSKSGAISQWTNDSNYATQSYVGSQGFITASSSDTLTNKSGNISQWSNDSNYATQSYVTSQGYISSAYVYGQTSLTGGGNAGSGTQYINLVNDSGSPGNNMLYGTNGSGTKGWYAQPSGGGGVSGSGTSGYFPIWNGSGSQTNSIIDMVSIALVRINGRLTLTDYLFPVQVTASTRAGMSVVVGGIVYQTDGGSAEGLWQYRSSGWVQL